MVPVNTADARTAVRVTVVGRVQGVGYRWFARECGRRLQIEGRVSNMPDGSVIVEAAGPASVIEAFLRELRSGPDLATVDELRAVALNPLEQYPSPFSIER
jgi:acylphosphatase